MPYLGSTVFVGAICLLALASLTGFFLLFRALSPGMVDRAERAATTRPFVSALIGFPAASVSLVSTAALAGAGPGPAKAAGILLFGVVTAFILGGVAGVAQRVGNALASPYGSPAARVLRGAVVLELAMLLPVVGWFLVLPLTIAIGTGAACLALGRAPKTHALPAVARGA
jgi:hypothetical protein